MDVERVFVAHGVVQVGEARRLDDDRPVTRALPAVAALEHRVAGILGVRPSKPGDRATPTAYEQGGRQQCPPL